MKQRRGASLRQKDSIVKMLKSLVLAAIAFMAPLAAPAHDLPMALDDTDSDGNRLWDKVEKTKQPMMLEIGLVDQYSLSMSDRLQFIMQEGMLHVYKPDIYEKIIKAHVRELACISMTSDDHRMADIVSVLEVSFAADGMKAESFQMVSDGMAKLALSKPDVTKASCSWEPWRRNDFTHAAPERPKYTGRIIHTKK
jgi:hypothetical protein